MSPTPHDPEDAITQYEALRGDATRATPGVGPSHGLALFLARGMAAWLAALSALRPPRPPAGHPEATPRSEAVVAFAPTVHAELTAVLAAMVLACTASVEEGEDDARGEGDGRPFATGRVSLRPPVVAPASA